MLFLPLLHDYNEEDAFKVLEEPASFSACAQVRQATPQYWETSGTQIPSSSFASHQSVCSHIYPSFIERQGNYVDL